jgi:hypothetical protein
MRGRPSRYTVQPPMSLTRPDVMRGPTLLFDRPRAGTPAPRLIRFPVGPAVLWAEGRAEVRWVGGEAFQISAPSIKDDAVPRVRKASDGGKCDGGPGRNRYTVQRSLRWLSRTAVRGATILFDRPRQDLHSSLQSFPFGPATLWNQCRAEVQWVRRNFSNRRPQSGTDGEEAADGGKCEGDPAGGTGRNR